MQNNPYKSLGIGLSIAGAILSPVFYFAVASVPLTAVGMSAIMLGFTSIALANARPYLSPEACRIFLRTGMENTAALLEELQISAKAIYLPVALRDGHGQAIIPLGGEVDTARLKEKLPGRLIVRYGPDFSTMALAVTTPGTASLELLESKPGPSIDEIESAITYVLTGILDVASGIKLNFVDSFINVEINGATLHYEDIWYYRSLGSPLASIAAAISSEALGKPVRIVEEKRIKGKDILKLEVLA
jgi:stage V sporulation protein SpoVS